VPVLVAAERLVWARDDQYLPQRTVLSLAGWDSICGPADFNHSLGRNILSRTLGKGDNRRVGMQDALDQRGKLLEGVALLVDEFIPVVNPAHAGHGVSDHALADVCRHAGTREERAGGPPQIVHRPLRERPAMPSGNRGIELPLQPRQAADRAVTTVREDESRAL